MAATPHLPANQPKGEHDMPQGTKNWDKPPQQVDGPNPPPAEAPTGRHNRKSPQSVDGPAGVDPQENWPPRGQAVDGGDVPQSVDGDDGPVATDGTELTQLSTAGPSAVAKKPPAKSASK